MNAIRKLQRQRERRKKSVRMRIRKRSDLPRLSVHRSSKHIYAQVIDDAAGRSICGAGTTAGSLKGELDGKTKTERAAIVGREIAKKAQDAGVSAVVFDRGSSKYHGRVKALAEAAREAGLKL